MLIERINEIIQINQIQNEYERRNGILPYNLSSWLTSKEFKETMIGTIDFPKIKSTIEYSYTYSFDKDVINNFIKKLFNNKQFNNVGISLAANTTQAIVTIVNMLNQFGYKKICVLNPAYFSLCKAHDALSTKYDILSIKRENGKYIIPYKEIKEGDYDVLWITSPIFSTSVYFEEKDINFIKGLMNAGVLVISDECFCTSGNEIINRIDSMDNFIGIYSPHKAIGVNGYKFSAIVFPKKFDEVIEHWVDILTGTLPASTEIALRHYVSDNYDDCLREYRLFMSRSYKNVMKILKKYSNIEFDNVLDGSLFTVYFNNLTYSQIKSIEFIKEMIFATGCSMYPSYLNGFNSEFGFAFRINMALYDGEFENALITLLDYLDNLKSIK